jgi:NAD(P)H-hydrate epimerase
MGDVLSGVIGAFLAQDADPFLAAAAGAYVHGLAGDAVYKQKGFHMVASDLVEALPGVLKRYDRLSRA